MEKRRKTGFFPVVYLLLGFCLLGAGVFLALKYRDAAPVLCKEPAAALQKAEQLLTSLCDRDYAGVSACLYGQPELGMDDDPRDPVGQLLWKALGESFAYTREEPLHATDSGVSLDVTIHCLDLDSVTGSLGSRAQSLLEERVAQAEDPSQIYDAHNAYREELLREVLMQAAQDALAEDAAQASYSVRLELVFAGDQWWILPEPELLKAITGGIYG